MGVGTGALTGPEQVVIRRVSGRNRQGTGGGGEAVKFAASGCIGPDFAPTAVASMKSVSALQAEYAAWSDGLPDNQRDSATAEALQAIVDLDLDDLAAIVPPRGFGRD